MDITKGLTASPDSMLMDAQQIPAPTHRLGNDVSAYDPSALDTSPGNYDPLSAPMRGIEGAGCDD